jgi:hypothetical protein
MSLRLIGAVALVFLYFQSSAIAQEQPRVAADPKIILLGDTSGAPRGCDARVGAAQFDALLQAVSNAAPRIMERFFGGRDGPVIYWYTVADMRGKRTNGFSGQSKDSLKAHFDGLSRSPEVMRVTRYRSLGWDRSETTGLLKNGFNIEFEARDRRTGKVTGYGFAKGGYYCDSKSFEGMSIAIKRDYRPMLGQE